MSKNNYAVILAGGVGSRFWPVSTTEHPKQFHDMLGTGKSLLQTTYYRLLKAVPKENVLVLTNAMYETLVKEQLPNLQEHQIILEPAMRNTAPSILLAAFKIQKLNPNAAMIVAPSDHWIEDEVSFVKEVDMLLDEARQKEILITLGIQPTFPNTGYGYIQYNTSSEKEIKKVENFSEKPNYELAKKFLAEGNYLWNAGIFIWSAKYIISCFKRDLLGMHQLFLEGYLFYNTREERNYIAANYHKAENISIDYGIMEKASDVFVKPASFDWNDLGTWGSLYDKMEKDNDETAVINAEVFATNASKNIIYSSGKKTIVVDGLEEYIIVDEEKVLLILPKAKEQEIKQIREEVLGKG